MHNRAAKVETLLKHLVGENLEEHVDGGGEDGGDVGDVHAAQDMWASETVMVVKDFWVIAKLVVNGSQLCPTTNLPIGNMYQHRLTCPLLPTVCQAIRLPATGATFKPSLENMMMLVIIDNDGDNGADGDDGDIWQDSTVKVFHIPLTLERLWWWCH